jgi:putative oxidoreductase
MLGAMALVHLKAGFFNPAGIEFPLALVGMTLALVLAGAGRFSVDALIAHRGQKVAKWKPEVQRRAA